MDDLVEMMREDGRGVTTRGTSRTATRGLIVQQCKA